MIVSFSPAQTAAQNPEAPYDRLPLRKADLLLIFAFWTFIGLLISANTLLDPRGIRTQPLVPFAPVAIAFIEAYLWAVITPLVFWLGSRFTLERGQWGAKFLLFFSVGLVIAVANDFATGFMRHGVLYEVPKELAGLGPVSRLTRFWFINEFLVYIAVLAAGIARAYFLRYRARREEAIRLQAQAAQLQAQLSEARLAALRNQLNPHFLFNTLHAVSALVERDPRGVRRMIARLSELLRTSLEESDEQEVPLAQELTFMQRYLEIMQIRFQGHLSVSTQVEPDVLDALVPNLILQPLVENAIKHGVSKLDDTGRIEIRGRREDDNVVLSVRDNGPTSMDDQLRAQEGVGLRNTRARLSQLYGTAQSLVLRAAPQGGVIAEVTVPYHTRADLRTSEVAVNA